MVADVPFGIKGNYPSYYCNNLLVSLFKGKKHVKGSLSKQIIFLSLQKSQAVRLKQYALTRFINLKKKMVP